ncbi:VOC family protein [Janthinobacterium fluminis]|uniref:VOC family protein n=1 Tax=Janthinobacterium fluminis TaxID=2987524 RepID=A0ABT5K216_9BURK|nr:VOC family protein [Janthinobacterium fluminis]MDC8759023.1 VOC family protein [Janthinobacterium fluminis]
MKLNHLNLQVSNAPEMAAFFVEYFGFVVTLEKPDRSLIALAADGFDLVLQESGDAKPSYPKGFHLGFILDDLEKVQTSYARLKHAGADLSAEIVQSRRGAQFFLTTLDGITVEIGCHYATDGVVESQSRQ